MNDDIERRMQEGEVEIDPPEITCAKIGHKWHEVVADGDDCAMYFERCSRCGAERVP